MTEVGYVLPLDDPTAELAVVGGKGASLSRLAAAGLPVPVGFHVMTAAYDEFVTGGGLRDRILDAASAVDTADPATFEAAAARIAALFDGPGMPAAVERAVGKAYAELGPEVVVAVRSSATAEDLPDMSFAGQQDSYLSIRGEAAVLDAVRRCWASLWTARAIGYRARNGIAAHEVSLAVVVQQLVPADAAGILFTVDPVTGADDRMVVNAGWGLGEAVVGGQVAPDTVTVAKDTGAVLDYQVGAKTVRTVRTAAGTAEEAVPAELRDRAVLAEEQVAQLARLGIRIEQLYGQPMDVEWALAGDQLYVVQARPITNVAAGEWNDSLAGDYLWSNGNLGEAIPDVMTPATWSFVQIFMSEAMASTSLPGYRGYGRIGGRFYLNLSMAASLSRVVGVSRKRFRAMTEPVYGKLPPDLAIPLIPLPRLRILAMLLPVIVRTLREIRGFKARMPEYMATAAARAEDLRAAIAATDQQAELVRLWHEQVGLYLVESSSMLAAGARQGVTALITAPRTLRKLVGEKDATAILSGQGEGDLASLGPMLGLARLARGEIDEQTFVRRYGHRGAHEFEVSQPRPGEDPAGQLAGLEQAAVGAEELLANQEAARQEAWRRLEQLYPGKVAKVRRQVARWAHAAQSREHTRSEVIRSFWVLRAWVLRAGELTGHGDDLFFLTLEEILAVLDGDESALAAVPRRRATYERYRLLPPYPTLIRGRFDPVRWAADPNRRVDRYEEHGAGAPADDTLTGFAGAAGVVEGTARLIKDVAEGDRLGAGEILVTAVTNIGWTPLFPRAAAVVTDVGAPLSHAAIVARELGIPAVVGCGNATARVDDGDRIRVDGERGTVEILSAR
ncbi:MAG: pyruvate, phosphate dikinase [Streptosporangiales bacterium]|nr:pyruvate, phosphate dikinase [Streptosporangiales bacterium]